MDTVVQCTQLMEDTDRARDGALNIPHTKSEAEVPRSASRAGYRSGSLCAKGCQRRHECTYASLGTHMLLRAVWHGSSDLRALANDTGDL